MDDTLYDSESILISVKKMLGLDKDYDAFDLDVILHINSVFMILNQLGVGLKSCFSIKDSSTQWSDFLGENTDADLVKSYMYLKVKLVFDPPTTGVLHEAMERQISEFEWRLNMQCDRPEEGGSNGDEPVE